MDINQFTYTRAIIVVSLCLAVSYFRVQSVVAEILHMSIARLALLLAAHQQTTAFPVGLKSLGKFKPVSRVRLSSTMDSLLNSPKLELNDGSFHPQIGFGTYKVGFIPASASSAVADPSDANKVERTARECVVDALSVGYRFLGKLLRSSDTAEYLT